MATSQRSWPVDRRTILKTGAAIAAVQFSSPYIIKARGETPVRIGMVDPLTGVYAAIAQSEVVGAKFATEEINKKGGILGRPVELLVEDSANDVGTGVQKTRKLIERDQVSFIIGDVNSGIAIAMAQVTSEKKVLHIVSGGHTDPITGANCSWNVFRICNSTSMDANAIASTLMEKFGKKWYFLTPDYAYGHSVQAGFEKLLKAAGGTSAGSLVPLGTPDYSAYLIQAKAYDPQVLINVMGGGDQVSSLKQFVQFGLDKQMAVGGTLFELESIRAVPDGARVGWWTMEWWWDQPGVPHVAEFNASMKKITGLAATARNWFGYASVQTLAVIANQEKTLDAVPKLARALAGFKLPPEIALQPGAPAFRAGDHELMSTVFVGEAHPPQGDPDNMFTVQKPRARRKSRRTGRGHRLQDPVAGLTPIDTDARCLDAPGVPKLQKKTAIDQGELMTSQTFNPKFDRRTLVTKGAAALGCLPGGLTLHHPGARGETPIRIGMVDPLTGVYAAPAGNEVMGAKLAVEQINAKGGILGRQVELLVEDSANDVGTGVQKARKLIERDQVNFMIGDVNSGIAAAIAQVTAEKKILHIVSGGHTDFDHRQGLQMERVPGLQHHADGSQFGIERAVQQVRQEMALHHARLRLRPYAV